MLRGLDVVSPTPMPTPAGFGGENATVLTFVRNHAPFPNALVGALVVAFAFGLMDVYQTYLAWLYVPGFYEMNALSPFQDNINSGDFGGALAFKILALLALTFGGWWIFRAYPETHWIQRVNYAWIGVWAGIQVTVVMFGVWNLFRYAAVMAAG